MDAMELPRAHILGFSDGANIAMCFALAHPERVSRLILNGGNLYPAGVRFADQREITRQYREAAAAAEHDPGAVADAEMLGLMVNDPNIMPWHLRKLTMPTLVIAGTHDVIRTGHTRLIARCIPHARLVLLPGDHFIAANRPEEFNRAVHAFLADS